MVNYVSKYKVYVQPGKIESKRKTSTRKEGYEEKVIVYYSTIIQG